MVRLFAVAAIALAPFATPALAQEAQVTCEPESLVVLDRVQPDENISETENSNIDGAVVSRFVNVPRTECYPQAQTIVTEEPPIVTEMDVVLLAEDFDQ